MCASNCIRGSVVCDTKIVCVIIFVRAWKVVNHMVYVKKRFFVFYESVTQFVYCRSSGVSFTLYKCFFDCKSD